jgi:hypothetical protein
MAARTIRSIRTCLGLVALLLALPTLAGEVYTWKDAKGVTHYSDSPPPDSAYKKTRTDDAPPAPAAKAEDPRCTIARSNLEKMKDPKGPVGLDANGDGKPDKEMTAEEIAQQVKYAQETVKYTCAPAAQ